MGTLQENQSLNAEYERNKKEREMKEEIERLYSIIKEQGLEDKPNYYVKGLEGSLKEYQEEVKRLNNIIKRLEKWVEEDENKAMITFETGRCFNYHDIINKIEELKGSE